MPQRRLGSICSQRLTQSPPTMQGCQHLSSNQKMKSSQKWPLTQRMTPSAKNPKKRPALMSNHLQAALYRRGALALD